MYKIKIQTLAKAQRTRGWVLLTKVTNFFLVNFLHKSWSNLILRILIKHQPKHLNQTSAVVLNFNNTILTRPSLRISNKIKLHNLNQASAAKCWPNFSFKILPELQLQNLDQHQQKEQPQQVLSRHLHTPGSNQSSLLNRSELVS